MKIVRKPDWLKINIVSGSGIRKVENTLNELTLSSVCKEAKCPNRGECYSNKTATFIILGKECTRDCRFCNISRNKPLSPDLNEPKNLAKAVRNLGLKYVVITSVTRDDLPDGGAEHFVNTINEVRTLNPDADIEVLIPDFNGSLKSLQMVIKAAPLVLNHNIETVERLYPKVRFGADYNRSLSILKYSKEAGIKYTKSGIILGMGEKESEVIELLKDLRRFKCDLLTIGQYLSPSKKHLPVSAYITPEQFNKFEEVAYELGFKGVKSGPLVRSSYNARSLICTT